MSNPAPIRPYNEVLFKGQWQTGKTVQQRIPIAIKSPVVEIARCIDRNPAIADEVLKFAQSLVEQK